MVTTLTLLNEKVRWSTSEPIEALYPQAAFSTCAWRVYRKSITALRLRR